MLKITEGIMFALLLLYPGAFADVVYMLIYKERNHENKKYTDEMKLARYFVVSVLISGVSYFISHKLFGGLNLNIADEINIENRAVFHYFLVSVSITILYAWAIRGWVWDKKLKRIITRTPDYFETSNYSTSWDYLKHSERYDYTDSIVAIFDGSEFLTAGMVGAFPVDFQEDKGLVLEYTDIVTPYFKEYLKENKYKKYFNHTLVEYHDMGSRRYIRIYNGHALATHISDLARA